MTTNVPTALRYLSAIEQRASADELARFCTDDVIQEEFPNLLTPAGARRDLAGMLDGHERGKHVIARQVYDVATAVEAGDLVVLEVRWSGTLARAVASLPAGAVMRARFAVFLQFRDGRIAAQRNYDCFEPW